MPIKAGKSQATVSANIAEIHKGPQYRKTAETHGKSVADKQAIAIALDKKRESMSDTRRLANGVILRRTSR